MRILSALLIAALTSATTPAFAGQHDVSGEFEGGYVCVQGQTFVRVMADAHEDGSMDATFAFGSARWDGGSNAVPHGSFALKGSWKGASFTLHPDHWIERPDGFEMVGMTGEAKDNRLFGTIDFDGCKSFSVTRK